MIKTAKILLGLLKDKFLTCGRVGLVNYAYFRGVHLKPIQLCYINCHTILQ